VRTRTKAEGGEYFHTTAQRRKGATTQLNTATILSLSLLKKSVMAKRITQMFSELPKDLSDFDLLDDAQCCKMLSVSLRTLYSYRKKN